MDDLKINPIHQYAPGEKINPIRHVMEQTPTQTIITKKNIGNVRGNMIYTRLGGYDIYAPLDSVISIDSEQRNVFIFDKEDNTTSPANERQYLLLFVSQDESEIDDFMWIMTYGRQEAFNQIVELADVMNLQESLILAETVRLKGAISMYSFVKQCIDKEVVENPTGFDYTDYSTEVFDDIEEEE